MARRTVKLRKASTQDQVKKRQDRTHEQRISGGRQDVIGFTAGLAEATDYERMEKGIYGLFEGGGNPHYQVVTGNVLDNRQWRIIEPVYSHKDLLKIFHSSTILRECVDAYVTNIEGYGYDLEYCGPEGQQESRAATNEKYRIDRLMGTLTSDGRPLKDHRENSRVDKELLGARCFEVIRDLAGRVVAFDHVEACSVKMTTKDKEEVATEVTDPVTGTTRPVTRRFRRFVQIDAETGKRTYFKEFGDPRTINPANGEVDNSISVEDEATELYYEAIYSPGTPCGVPRWAGAIPSLLGSREAEMVNLNFFRDNAIPALAVLVSGGALTEESFEKIDQYITGVRGAASMNRIVVMEAVSDGAEAAAIDGSLPAPKIDIKPMLSERQHEGLFQDYIKEGERKSRQSFRLPPIYVGSAEEYNRASAFASMLTADQQVFVPERMAWDEMFDRIVLSTHNLKYWRVRSSGPGLQDPAEVARLVNSLGREGALTPNIAIKLANRYLDADIQPVMEEWGDLPFNIIMSYVDNGDTLKGLDIFEERVEQTVQQAPGENVEDDDVTLADANSKLQKTVRRLLGKVSDKMRQQLEDAVQSIAAE